MHISITVGRDDAVHLKPQTAVKVVIALISLLSNNELDQELDLKLMPRIISMNDYLEKYPHLRKEVEL
jgi:hypothetical protein